MRNATIVVADTHELFAQGLRHLLQARPGFTVIDVVTDGFAALETCRQQPPGVLIIESTIGGLDALEVCRQLARFSSPTRPLLSMPHIQHELAAQSLKCGVWGAVLKNCNLEQMYAAIDAVLSGQKHFPAELAPRAAGTSATASPPSRRRRSRGLPPASEPSSSFWPKAIA